MEVVGGNKVIVKMFSTLIKDKRINLGDSLNELSIYANKLISLGKITKYGEVVENEGS